jgi:EAL domain-containing protein (putative c-di-GMP-specific phosphodiesterase class I)
MRLVAELRQMGCRIALGDFGRRKVSFDMLNHLPVHFLKIDGSVMQNIDADPVNLAKIQAIGRVSEAIHVNTIAQFVDSLALLPKLHELGIDYAQGYGISRPLPIDDLMA